MSRVHGHVPTVAIEWSPNRVRVYDSVSKVTNEYESLREVGSSASRSPVTIAIGRRNVFVRSTRLPNAPIEDLRPIVKMRIGEMFPLASSDLAFDISLLDDITPEGRLAMIVAMPASDLRQILADAKLGNVKIERVVPVSFGSTLLAQTTGHLDCAVVGTDLSGIGIDIVSHGALVNSRVTVNSAALQSEVCRTHQVAGLPCGDAIAAGDVQFPEAQHHSRGTSLEMLCTPNSAAIHINLRLPEAVEAERAKIKRNAISRSIILCTGAAAIWAFVVNDYTDRQSNVDKLAASQAKETKRLVGIQTAFEKKAVDAAALTSLVAGSFKCAQSFGDLIVVVNNRVPQGVWLTGISVERGKEIMIRGTAKTSVDVANFTTNLKQEERLRDVHLSFANNGTIDKTQVVQFSISAFPIGNLPLSDLTKKGKK